MGAVRTAIGKYGGSLKTVPAHELGALVIREVLERAHVDGTMVDEVILGEVRQSTEASNIARCAALEAGLPESVPGFTVNLHAGNPFRLSGNLVRPAWRYCCWRHRKYESCACIPERCSLGW